eukprot:4776310-Prymnesium_polylepis.1
MRSVQFECLSCFVRAPVYKAFVVCCEGRSCVIDLFVLLVRCGVPGRLRPSALSVEYASARRACGERAECVSVPMRSAWSQHGVAVPQSILSLPVYFVKRP